MTERLVRAIAEIEKLPSDAQDAIASRLLAEVADELEWERQFASTTESQWDRMAKAVRKQISEEELRRTPKSGQKGKSESKEGASLNEI